MSKPTESNFDDPSPQITRQVAPTDWERAELEAQSAPIPPRERLFPRKVLIGWALFALALYFGVKVAGIAIKEGFKQAAIYTTGVETTPDNREVIYVTPNGKLTIIKDRKTGQITIRKSSGRGGAPSAAPATTAQPAPAKR